MVVRGLVRRVVRGVVRRVVRGVGSVGSPRSGGQFFQLSLRGKRITMSVKQKPNSQTSETNHYYKGGQSLNIC